MTYTIPYPESVDLSLFNKPMDKLEAKYGLPREVKFCKRCVISNQRPNSAIEYSHTKTTQKETIHFDENGVCDACRAAERKNEVINWEHREAELKALCDRHRSKDGSYDCIVPGSGGKDSFYAAHMLREKYGMHPLTVTWAPHLYTPWGWENFQSWIHAGFDNYLHTPNGRVHRLLTRLAVEKLFHPFQPFMIGQKSIAPKMAILHNIPLVFYGENEAEYGNPIEDNNTSKRDWSFYTSADKKNVYLSGISIQDLQEKFQLTQADLSPYMPVDPNQLEEKKVEVHYLGYYLKWHPQSCYYYAVKHGNFKASPERTPGTYSKYNSIDDKMDDFHYYTTFIKFGIGRATYDAAQEIRSGDIERHEGVSLVKRFDGEFPERFANTVFDYLSIPEEEYGVVSKLFESPMMDRVYFERLTDQFRSPHLWAYKDNQWNLRHHIWQSEYNEQTICFTPA